MSNCFVIQPFDAGKFDKRYTDVFEPAIIEAGLQPYRVDRDPAVAVPIEGIEEGIREATVCLADITTDNPNVWYELGYAFAANRQVVMVCSDERSGGRFPFDIQHRTVIRYQVESPSDFDTLRRSISDRIKALMGKAATLRQIAEAQQVAPQHGLTQPELTVLAVLAGETSLPYSVTSLLSLQNEVEKAGLTPIGFSLGYRRLSSKEMVGSAEVQDDRGDTYTGVKLTDLGWEWIERNEALFSLRRSEEATPGGEANDEIPF